MTGIACARRVLLLAPLVVLLTAAGAWAGWTPVGYDYKYTYPGDSSGDTCLPPPYAPNVKVGSWERESGRGYVKASIECWYAYNDKGHPIPYDNCAGIQSTLLAKLKLEGRPPPRRPQTWRQRAYNHGTWTHPLQQINFGGGEPFPRWNVALLTSEKAIDRESSQYAYKDETSPNWTGGWGYFGLDSSLISIGTTEYFFAAGDRAQVQAHVAMTTGKIKASATVSTSSWGCRYD